MVPNRHETILDPAANIKYPPLAQTGRVPIK